jgi:hypothetical protein
VDSFANEVLRLLRLGAKIFEILSPRGYSEDPKAAMYCQKLIFGSLPLAARCNSEGMGRFLFRGFSF